jgi:uncharacterized protein YndB with AHSA1/START domain
MTLVPKPGATTYMLPSDTEIVVTRVVQAPRRLVFAAHTEPRHIQRWMLGPQGWTMPTCEVDLRVGGSWHFVWRGPDGASLEMRGVYQEVAPPERLVSTESWGSDWPETLNTLTLTEADSLTTITTQVLYVSKDRRDAALQTGMQEGMSAGLDRLAEYLETMKE